MRSTPFLAGWHSTFAITADQVGIGLGPGCKSATQTQVLASEDAARATIALISSTVLKLELPTTLQDLFDQHIERATGPDVSLSVLPCSLASRLTRR